MQTTFPRLMLEHARQRPTAPALREKVYGIRQTLTCADLAQHDIFNILCHNGNARGGRFSRGCSWCHTGRQQCAADCEPCPDHEAASRKLLLFRG